jgi:protein phosphatase
MQGWRESMEDDHSIKLNLDKHPNCGFFGIFDGHCGKLASKFCGELMHKYIDEVNEIMNTDEITKQIIKLDSDFLEKHMHAEDGSTAIFVTIKTSVDENDIKNYNLVVGNIGDSRAVLGRYQDGVFNFTPLSEDHKPNNFQEQSRIVEAGGFVSLNRVRGNLALSRAIGDRSYKVPTGFPPDKLMVTCVPEYRKTEVISTSDFLLLACDGIYEGDIFTPETVVQFISEKLQQTDDLAKITSDLLDECVTRGSKDNMSAMLIQFKDGTSYNSDNEYVPGIYHEEQRFNDFQNAYRFFAEQAGFTVEQSRKLYEEKYKPQ